MSKTPGTRPWSPPPARAGARSDRRVGSGAGQGWRSSETQVVALIRQTGCRSYLNPCSRTRWSGRKGGALCVAPGYQVLHLSTGSTVAASKYRPTPVAVVARRTTSPAPDRTRLLPPSSTAVAQFFRLKAASPPKLTIEIRLGPTYIQTPSSFWSLGWGKVERINTSTHTYYAAKFTHAISRVFFGNFVLFGFKLNLEVLY
jgi:hypothetical protein